MKIEVLEERENPLLQRKKLKIRIVHDASTPRWEEVREKIKALESAGKGTVVVDSFQSKYGARESVGVVKIYKSRERALEVEPRHILEKNALVEKKVPKEKEKPEEKPAEKPEKPEEKPKEEKAPKEEKPKKAKPKEEEKEEEEKVEEAPKEKKETVEKKAEEPRKEKTQTEERKKKPAEKKLTKEGK